MYLYNFCQVKGNKYKKGGKISRGALIKTTARLKQDQNPPAGFFQCFFFLYKCYSSQRHRKKRLIAFSS